MKPICTFRVYPKMRGLYYEVYVWKNSKGLRKHVTWCKPGRDCKGLCSTFTCWSVKKGLSRKCGEIHFIDKNLGIECVTHELEHAVLGWARRNKIKLNEESSSGMMKADCPEERLCYAMGRMAAQVTNKFFKYGVWK